MTVDQVTFRAALAQVPTAVSVITTVSEDGAPWGVTIGTFGSLSLTPPLIMFCLDRGGASHQILTTSTRFLVHVLGEQQADVAISFARREGHGFSGGYPTAYGLPTIPQAMSRLLCERSDLARGGDHTIVIGLVEHIEIGTGPPLLYYGRRYCSLNRRIECRANRVTAGSVRS
jgi:flavin reductase ActVB